MERFRLRGDSRVRLILRVVLLSPQLLLAFFVCKIPFLKRYRDRLLSTWQNPEKRAVLDRFLFPHVFHVWFRLVYLREPDPDKREELKILAMGGESGRKWAEYYESKPLDLDSKIRTSTLREINPVFDGVESLLREAETPRVVVQIGSSSGREIAYFAEKFPEHQFIGTEIALEVVDHACRAHDLQNLEFVICPAKEISRLLGDFNRQNIVVFSCGSLQYVQPEHLQVFFRDLACHLCLHVLLTEPANDSRGRPNEMGGSLWRGIFPIRMIIDTMQKRLA